MKRLLLATILLAGCAGEITKEEKEFVTENLHLLTNYGLALTSLGGQVAIVINNARREQRNPTQGEWLAIKRAGDLVHQEFSKAMEEALAGDTRSPAVVVPAN